MLSRYADEGGVFTDISNSDHLDRVAQWIEASKDLKDLGVDKGHRSLIFLENVFHKTALIFSIAKGYSHSEKIIPILKMASHSQSTVIDAFLKHPNIKMIINAQDDRGNTALHLACIHRDKQLISRLLQAGANPSLQNKNGQTPRDIIERTSYLEANMTLGEYTGTDYLQMNQTVTFTLQSENVWMKSKDACLNCFISTLNNVAKESVSPTSSVETRDDRNAGGTTGSHFYLISYDKLKNFINTHKPSNTGFNFFHQEIPHAIAALHQLLSTKSPGEFFTLAEILTCIGLASKTEMPRMMIQYTYLPMSIAEMEQDCAENKRIKSPEERFFFELGIMIKEVIASYEQNLPSVESKNI